MTDQPVLCVTCPVLRAGKPHRPTIPHVCDTCRTRMAGDLTAIPAMFAAIPDHLEPGQHGGERRAGGFESRPPVNIPALSLIGPGTDTPRAYLDFWVQDWATTRRESLPTPTVAVLAAWLHNRLDWACAHHPAIDEFASDMWGIVAQLRPFQAREAGEPAGRCPRKPGDQRCNTPLTVDPYDDTIRCRRCGAEWNRKDGQWLQLRGQQIAAGVDAT